MWDRVTVPLGIEQCLDVIFAGILVGGLDKSSPTYRDDMEKKLSIARTCRPKFLGNFATNIFYNSYALFYEIIVTFNTKTFSIEQLDSIIENNRDLILNSPYINKANYAVSSNGNIPTDDDIISAVTMDLKEKFVSLSASLVSEDEFDSSCTIYIDWYKSNFMWYISNNMSAIMNDNGYDDKLPGKRTRHYQGLADCIEYYNNNFKIIRSLSDESRIRSIVIDSSWLENDMQNENLADDKALFSVGIEEVDQTLGDLRRGNMLGIMGPPKGGKTRFTNYLVQRALRLGYNVAVWPLEGTMEEWLAMQTACFITTSSFEDAKRTNRDNILRISSKDILQRKFRNSPQIRQIIASAKTTMAVSEKFGRLSFIEGTAYCEDFLDVIRDHYENDNPFDVIVIDSLVNIMSKRGKGKVERISEAYMAMHNFISNGLKRPVLALVPAQLKQEVVDLMRKDPEAELDVTSGGESAETIRTPDAVIGLMSTQEERDANQMHLYSVASRHNADFRPFKARCYLESCFFCSESDDVSHVM